jgi:peptide/nickel transport system substrate-binding protein
MRKRLRYLAPLLVATLVAAAGCAEDGGDPGGGGDTEGGEFPRNETLYMSGQQWGPPSNWSPLPGSQATGVRGLIYETLFTFDPWTTELQPYLAESGQWVSENVYEVTLREGIEWTDGTPMTAEDVVFTVELGQIPSVPYSNLWNWLESAEAVDDRTARFTFTEPRVGEWEIWIYSRQILPRHIWESHANDDIMSFANENPVGSGPYKYHSHTEQRMVLERNDDWWGTEALGLEMQPRYIVDIVNPSNEVALGLISRGQVDLSTNFLPGIDQLVEGDFNITTFYPDPPYMLPANTAMLIPNHEREPLDDPAFRRALAFSINVQLIVENVYRNIVQPASPVGLHPVWEQFVDQNVVSASGFAADMAQSYNPDTARQILADAGYEDTNGDGFVETPDGEEIELTLITPAGWTDWNGAADVVATGAQEVGINIIPQTPDAGAVDDARTTGDFDLLFNNWTGLESTPWQLYNYVFQLPVQENQATNNFARYENEEGWELTQQVGRLSAQDPAIQEPQTRLQEIMLEEMPVIPMWYNGLWSQVNNDVWTNWPSDAPDTPDYYPSNWGGQFEKGAVFMLAEIELAADSE